MEVPNSNKFPFGVLLTEFLGTIFFILAFNMNSDGTVLVPFMLFSLIIATGTISGGHMNPGVTVAVYVEREKYKSNFCFMIMIIFAQILGAFCAMAFGFLLRVSMPVEGKEDEFYFVPSV